MMNIQAIQMVGTQRSGSNLLRLLLNQYPEIAAPHPPHILQRFYPLLPLYGDLSDWENMFRLTDDICKLVETNPVPWTGVRLDRQEIADACRQNTLIEIFRVVYEQAAIRQHAGMWLCKSMANVHFAEEMDSAGLCPKYIYLYRDGRDVACSFRKAIVGEKHVYHIAKAWRKNQLMCLELEKKNRSDRFIRISYENLIHSPEKEMKRMAAYLDLEYDPDIFSYYQSEESRNTSVAGKMWENVAKPILAGNSKKFLKELSKEEIIIFEAVTGDVLGKLGYEPEYPAEAAALKFSERDLERFEAENQDLKQKCKLNIDPEGMRLRKAQDELLENIQKSAMESIWIK